MIILIFLASSCKKDPTTWDTEVSTPILKSTLTIQDLFSDSLLIVDDDNLASIYFNEEIFSLGIDSLLEDTAGDTITDIFTIEPLQQFTFTPGQQFFTSQDDFELRALDAELKYIKLESGVLKVRATNTIPSKLNFVMTIPKATLNGEPLQIESVIPQATTTHIGELEMEIDFSNYSLDLSGETGDDFNILGIDFALSIPEDGNPTLVLNTDEVVLSTTYDNLEVNFASGYLGSESFSFSEGSRFNELEDLQGAIIDLESAQMGLGFTNGFGVDIRTQIFDFIAKNSHSEIQSSLNHNLIGSNINLTRASLSGEQIVETTQHYDITSDNSNIVDLIELIPDSIKADGSAQLNPFGNIGNYNDFASISSVLKCDAEVEIPLRASISNLSLRDTSTLEWSGDYHILKIKLYLLAENSFPADAEIDIWVANEQNQIILNLRDYLKLSDSPTLLGRTGDNPEHTLLVYELDKAAVEVFQTGAHLIANVEFQTTNYPTRMVFTGSDKVELILSADAGLTLEVE
ncbi:MAG TPA: hypothetical protein VJ911_03285 [Cryomorphaceae bacterium]|nr:hypothetical protein [Cryomorphaceae bacterium]